MKHTQTSFPLLGILAIVFITLKLAGVGVVARWPWWLVLSPLWGAIALGLLVAIIALMIAIVVEARREFPR